MVSLGEKDSFYVRYNLRNSCSSSSKQLHVKSEILGTMFIKDRERYFRYSIGLTLRKT